MRAIRYTNSKGNSITLGTSPIPTTLQDGIVGCWPMDNVSEYPDNASGTTYIQGTSTSDTWAGWAYSGSGGSIAISSGDLTLTCGAAGDGFVRTMSVLANKQWRLKVKSNAAYGSRTISIYNGTSETTYAITASTSYQLVDVISALAFSTVTIRVNNCVATEVYTFDFVYVGDGTYSSKLPDISTQVHNFSIFGAMTANGPYNKAMTFNGTTNYLRNNDLISYSVYSLQLWYQGTESGDKRLFAINRNTDSLRIELSMTGGQARLRWWNDTALISILSVTLINDGNWHHICGTHDGTTGKLYVDGVLKNSSNNGLTSLIYNTVTVAADTASTPTIFTSGSISMPIVHSRALTAAEVNAFYRQNASPFVATGETTYGVVESISGIDQAETNVASTRAPVQDGATYIDTLLNIRELAVDGSLTVPKNIDTIYAQRKIVQDVLNPKYGLGTLDFFYGRNTINHRTMKNVAVDKLTFPNKPYQNPYQSFSVSFDGNDPYWYDPLTGTGSICILSGTSRTFTVGGENDTPPQITIYGAATNPTITNATTSETISMTYSLSGGSYINIDTNFGAKTIKLNGSTNLIGSLNIGSTFPRFQVGSNTVSYTGGGYIIIMWRNRYVGV